MLLGPRPPTYSSGSDSLKSPCLRLEEDESLNQYRISAYGGLAAGSTLTLSEWRPIELPGHLIESAEPPSPGVASDSTDEQKDLLRKTAGRFGAWIKRSGQRLVIRFQNRTPAKAREFTDVHIGYEKPELAGWPIPHPPQDAWLQDDFQPECQLSPSSQYYEGDHYFEELPDNSKSELPDTVSRTELPAVVNSELLMEDNSVVQDPVQRERRPLSLDLETRAEDALSPAATIRTNFSTAETAVESDVVAERKSEMHHGSTVARGLSILGSINYRCHSDQDLSNASPTELVNLASLEPDQLVPSKSIYASGVRNPRRKLRMPVYHARLEGMPADSIPSGIDPAGKDLNGQQKRLLARNRGQLMHPIYSPPSNHMMYHQDLHFNTTHVQAENISLEASGAEDRIIKKIELLLEKALIPTTITSGDHPLQQDRGNSGKPIAGDTSSALMAQVPLVDEHNVTGGEAKMIPCGSKADFCSSPTASPNAARAAECRPPPDFNPLLRDPTARTDEARRMEDAIRVATISPISPLTEEEQVQRQGSIASQLDPVTPVTPKVRHTEESVSEPIDHESSDDSDTSAPTSTFESCGNAGTYSPRSKSPVSVYVTEEIGSKTGKAGFLADFVDYKPSGVPVEPTPLAPLGFFTDDKIPARYKNTRIKTPVPQIDTTVADRSPPTVITPTHGNAAVLQNEYLLRTGRAEPQQIGHVTSSYNVLLRAVTGIALRSILWIQRHSEPEPPVPNGHIRVRWRCSCGDSLYDDFVELRPGAASLLEAQLNNVANLPYSMPQSSSGSSSATFGYTPNSASQPSSSATSLSSTSGFGTPSRRSFKKSRVDLDHGTCRERDIHPYQGPRYLLTCISETRNTPKLSQIPLHTANIHSDKDLAIALRDHYALVNRSWYRKLRLRGLTSIEFIEFYKHCNSFADIRQCPGVPPNGFPHDYEFTPSAVLPPVGSNYLVHLFKHPHEYEDEEIAYHSIPKKTSKLHYGVGWGIQLTEGFLPERIWVFIIVSIMLFGCVFALVWTIKQHDIQGAFGVASFVTTLVSMMFGFVQACLG